MTGYLLLPLVFLKFWYIEAPLGIIGYFASLNHAFFELFSLPLFLRTFFKPLKNEYREGLVVFSRVMGMIVKTFFILLVFELCVLALFLLFPLITIALLYE
jgi:hypothetical protein